jgi:hypothetical protein
MDWPRLSCAFGRTPRTLAGLQSGSGTVDAWRRSVENEVKMVGLIWYTVRRLSACRKGWHKLKWSACHRNHINDRYSSMITINVVIGITRSLLKLHRFSDAPNPGLSDTSSTPHHCATALWYRSVCATTLTSSVFVFSYLSAVIGGYFLAIHGWFTKC